MVNHVYEEERREIYSSMASEGVFTWDRLYEQEYALASCFPLSASLHRQLRVATEELGEVFARVITVVQAGEEELFHTLGIPPAIRRAVRLSVDPTQATTIGRFDFANTKQGVKMLEFNADTPTGIVEAFYVNGRVCEAREEINPNQGNEADLRKAFAHVLKCYRDQGYETENIVFSALGWHEEDAGTTRYLLKQSGLNAHFVPLADLRVQGDQLYAQIEGRRMPVHVWYRLHPLEVLVEDHDDNGYPTGEHVLDLVAAKKLALINPPSAFIGQTKALQALIWSLHEEGEFFTPAEHKIISTYMLPTYLENRFTRQPYVEKPIFGREGGAVVLYNEAGEIEAQDGAEHYWNQMKVYQQRVELEQVETMTEKGLFRGHQLWGSFLIGGKASAVLSRIDGPITGNLSYFLPVGLCSDEID
ncbi:glutathionylspermidine synthase family protein [Mechercharimyces sp. CAU 1602]|uniref:glutathionylspermidine synthase family protein n=1 Tax=Mechercharimyces sp. CAU 1602 TaxID=2973933 RepID=UPI0021616E23|nr:glutathionylspermidine synthase family protein [Mechercharimyces sp. CAU 1602]MCS1350212.1 glutathionylspermidine synthase family protein [Mechercharimyces sp. CAU 1602]